MERLKDHASVYMPGACELERSAAVPAEANALPPCDPAAPPRGAPNRNELYRPNDLDQKARSSVFLIAPNRKQPRCPSAELINGGSSLTHGICPTIKRTTCKYTHDTTGKSKKHDAECSEPDTKGSTLHGNLISLPCNHGPT